MSSFFRKTAAALLTTALVLNCAFSVALAEETATEEENLIANPGFEVLDANANPEGWSPMGGDWDSTPHVFSDDTTVHSGDRSLRITTEKWGNPWVKCRVDNVVVGAEYEISAYINATFTGDAERGVGFKAESYGSASANINMDTIKYSTNNQWVPLTCRFKIPEGAEYLLIYCRIFTNGTVWFDDLTLKRAADPPKYSFDVDDVFHYPNQKSGTAYVNVNPFFQNTSVAAETRVDFSLMDGETVVHTQPDTTVNGSVATYVYDTALLTEMKKQYTLKAVVKTRTGEETETYTRALYKYPRPAWMQADGTYKAPGEEVFNPVFAYHVDIDTYAKVHEMGINVVQIPYWYTGTSEKEVKGREQILRDLEANGMKALFCLYRNMKMAGDPVNIKNTKYVVDLYKDDPRIFAWAIMDEPLGAGITEEKLQTLEDSYRAVRDIDDNHPVYVDDYSQATNKVSARYSDVFAADYYPVASTQGLTAKLREVKEDMVADKKPYLYLGPTFQNMKGGYVPTAAFIRGWGYTAFEEGTMGIGYFSISDTLYSEDGTERIPIYDTEVWEPLCKYGKNEVPLLIDYFCNKKYTTFCEKYGANTGTSLVWYSWLVGEDVYWVVHNRAPAETKVEIPLKSTNGLVSLGEYTAVPVGGATETIRGNDTLSLALDKEQVVMYKITPAVKPDLSRLSAKQFTDLDGYEWATDAILDLAGKSIVNTMGENLFAPGKNITRGDFAMFLMRALQLQADSTENFTDVDDTEYYATEIAAGKALDILQGVGDGSFHPTAEITRQDMLTICLRGLHAAGKDVQSDAAALDGFGDAASIAEYALTAVSAMVAADIVQGDENGHINPSSPATRAEAAVIMQRIMHLDAPATAPKQPEKTEPVEIVPEVVTFADTPSEADLADWQNAVTLLAKLGIVDENLRVAEAVSRAEAAQIFAKLLGGITSQNAESVFGDVPTTSKFAQSIAALYKLGYMSGSGDGTFLPTKPLSYNAAVKILVTMLGREVYAQRDGGYPAGYLTTAASIDLLKGTKNEGEQPIRAGVLARLIRNALDIDVVAETGFGASAGRYETADGVTLLTQYFNTYKYTGIVDATHLTSLQGAVRPAKGYVSVSGTVFEADKSGAEDFLGRRVVLYAEKDGENKIIHIEAAKNATVHVVDGDDVLASTGKTRMVYTSADKKERSFAIDSNAILIYNGGVKADWNENDLLDVNGTITLAMNNGDSAEVVFVNHSTTKIVDRVDPDEFLVFFKDGSSMTLDLRESGTVLCDKDGKSKAFSALSEWGVLSVEQSLSGVLVKAILSTDKVQGMIAEKATDTIKVGDAYYSTAQDSVTYAPLNKSLTFYMDYRGKIVTYNEDGGTGNYAYLTTVYKGKGIAADVQARLFTADGRMEIVPLAEKVSFNGTMTSKETVAASPLLMSGETPIGQLVTYTRNAEGVLTALNTAKDGSTIADDDERRNTFSMDYATGAGVGVRYIGYGMKIVAERYRMNSNTKIFLVPDTYSAEDSDYSVRPISYFNKYSANYYDVKIYDVDENYFAHAYVQTLNTTATNTDGLTAKYGVIKSVSTMLDETGTEVVGVTIIDHTNTESLLTYEDDKSGSPTVLLGKDAFTDVERETQVDENAGKRTVKENIYIADIHVGDVVEYYPNDSNAIILMKILARSHSLKTGEKSAQGMNEFYSYSVLSQFCGYIEELIEGGYVFTPAKYKRIMLYAGYPVASPICLYNSEKDTVQVITSSQLKIGDLVYAVRTSPYQKINLVVR